MADVVGTASKADTAAELERRARAPGSKRRALELVALRGRDVIGVRHLLEGGSAWIGNVSDSLARVPMTEHGGQPFLVGQVTGRQFILNVPPRARARMHGSDGLGRLSVGPHKICLGEGDRAVIVLAGAQIRAQIVPIETFARGLSLPSGVGGWIAFAGAVYIAALALCAALAPPTPHRLERGAVQRATSGFLTHPR